MAIQKRWGEMKKKYIFIQAQRADGQSMRIAILTAIMLVLACAPVHSGAETGGEERLAWTWSQGQVRAYRLELKELMLPQGRIAVNIEEFNAEGTTQFSRADGCILSQRNTGRMKLDMSIFATSSDEQEAVKSELQQTTNLRLLPRNTDGGRR